MGHVGARLFGFTRSKGRLWALLAFVAAVTIVAAWFSWPAAPPLPVAPTGQGPPPDPRLTIATRYRNVHPDVAYVGSARCVDCHPLIAASYREHPMGQSLAPLDDVKQFPQLAPEPPLAFDAGGMHYRIEMRDGALWHVESKRDAEGEIAAQAERVRYVIGSGTRGRSYLIERAGRLYQSPISWFAEEKRWDLSPGYATQKSHFTRPVTEACLFCHANHVDALPDAINRYRPPIFKGHAIGCERCHGPGELHARRQERGEEYQAPDDTIVQPGRLTPQLRDAVCAQCHLQGGQRVLRRGRAWFDYRPGLPLDAFVTTFVRTDMDLQKSVGQFEQLAESRCHKESQGKLGCISCHDPHKAPTPAEKVAFYRERCTNCHDGGKRGTGCRLPERDRQARGDSCIACHMPRADSVNVAHVSITDHRIIRQPAQAPAAKPPWQPLPLALFQSKGSDDRAELERDLGIALANVAALSRSREMATQAELRLRGATRRDNRDLDAWLGLAQALTLRQEHEEALAIVEATLAWAPHHEATLSRAASLAMTLRKLDRAIDYWQRLIALNPHAASYHAGLTNAHALRGDWPAAARAAEQAVRLNPLEPGPRASLIQALLRVQQRERAERELATLSRMRPGNLDEIRRWFER